MRNVGLSKIPMAYSFRHPDQIASEADSLSSINHHTSILLPFRRPASIYPNLNSSSLPMVRK